ncbi:unnamed protein product, partial [Polarella glacialis]
ASSGDLAAKLRAIREAAEALPEQCAGLLRASGAWDARAVEKFLKASSEPAAETRMEQFATESRRFTLLDPPGQRRSVAQAWSALSQSDCAILVVSARASERASGLAKGGQTREHAVLAKSLGIDSLIVAVNKMDTADGDSPWSGARFEKIQTEISDALLSVGFQESQLQFVPICATSGKNLVLEGDEECQAGKGWYPGAPLLTLLEMTSLPSRYDSQGPLRVMVTGVEKKGNTLVGLARVEQGELETGSAVQLLPGPESGVQAIEVGGRDLVLLQVFF